MRGVNFWEGLSAETLKTFLSYARATGAEEEARHIWDALCEVHGHRCDLCRVCTRWNKTGWTGKHTERGTL